MRRTVNGLPEPLNFSDPNFYGTYYWTSPLNPIDWPSAPEGIPVAVDDNLSGDDSRVIMDRVIPFVRDAVAGGDPFFTVVWFHTPHKPLPDPDGVSGVDSNDAYTDAIVGMDTQISRLRDELDTLGVGDSTMFGSAPTTALRTESGGQPPTELASAASMRAVCASLASSFGLKRFPQGARRISPQSPVTTTRLF